MPEFPQPIAVIGGGPAGSIAALCLRHLNRNVQLYEKSKFPRYRIGESLLPGTLSILARLGLADTLESMGFPKKRAATFIWGPKNEPWTFSFSTPKNRPWTYDHAYQVERTVFDQVLLNSARDRGAQIHENCEVTQVSENPDRRTGTLHWRKGGQEGQTEAPWVIDGSGRQGVVATSTQSRSFDPYFKNMALWSYFKGGKRFGGDLEGNIFSVATDSGWIWIIPLRNDTYSVGVVTDGSINASMRNSSLEAAYNRLLAENTFTRELLQSAERCDQVRATRDWAYEASNYAIGRAFLCGDAACFIDPLFSQGVHLAAYSAVLASASIDFLLDHPGDTDPVRRWYDETYREAYQGYHEFLTAFYACNTHRKSNFWQRRNLANKKDDPFRKRGGSATDSEDMAQRGLTLGALWRHASGQLSEEFNETELSLRRLRWAGNRMKQFQTMHTVRWSSPQVGLRNTFRVDPVSFKLTQTVYLEDSRGRCFKNLGVNQDHRQILEATLTEPFNFRKLAREFRKAGVDGLPNELVGELLEQGFLTGFDSDHNPVTVENPLRFRGVGATDPLA